MMIGCVFVFWCRLRVVQCRSSWHSNKRPALSAPKAVSAARLMKAMILVDSVSHGAHGPIHGGQPILIRGRRSWQASTRLDVPTLCFQPGSHLSPSPDSRPSSIRNSLIFVSLSGTVAPPATPLTVEAPGNRSLVAEMEVQRTRLACASRLARIRALLDVLKVGRVLRG
jgi:hypothetical protein